MFYCRSQLNCPSLNHHLSPSPSFILQNSTPVTSKRDRMTQAMPYSRLRARPPKTGRASTYNACRRRALPSPHPKASKYPIVRFGGFENESVYHRDSETVAHRQPHRIDTDNKNSRGHIQIVARGGTAPSAPARRRVSPRRCSMTGAVWDISPQLQRDKASHSWRHNS